MNIRHLSALITAIALSASFTSCGDKDDRSSSKSNVVEAQNIEPSTVETSESTPSLEVGESATETDWQKLKDDYQNSVLDKDDNSNTDTGIIKHTDRDYDGYYLEDYITVNFTGYEHDSDAEVIVDWEKIANDLGNGITPEILESLFTFRIRDVPELQVAIMNNQPVVYLKIWCSVYTKSHLNVMKPAKTSICTIVQKLEIYCLKTIQ